MISALHCLGGSVYRVLLQGMKEREAAEWRKEREAHTFLALQVAL